MGDHTNQRNLDDSLRDDVEGDKKSCCATHTAYGAPLAGQRQARLAAPVARSARFAHRPHPRRTHRCGSVTDTLRRLEMGRYRIKVKRRN